MITHETKIRVRYGETDQMGFLYHARYVDYYDVGRTELFRSLGSSNKILEEDGIMLPVLEVVSNYKTPAYYDDLLTIRTTLREIPTARMTFYCEVFRENGQLINSGHVTLAFMKADTRRACRAPQWFMDLINKHFNQQ